MGKEMKRIRLDPKPLTVLGKPFRLQDLEQDPPSETYTCERCSNEVVVVKPVIIEDRYIEKTVIFFICSVFYLVNN